MPNDATNANASATPPNWASTPHSEVTKRLVTLLAFAVLTAYARMPPITAPANAVTADSTTELRRARSTAGDVSASTLARVNAVVGVEERADERPRGSGSAGRPSCRRRRGRRPGGHSTGDAGRVPSFAGRQPTALAQLAAR